MKHFKWDRRPERDDVGATMEAMQPSRPYIGGGQHEPHHEPSEWRKLFSMVKARGLYVNEGPNGYSIEEHHVVLFGPADFNSTVAFLETKALTTEGEDWLRRNNKRRA